MESNCNGVDDSPDELNGFSDYWEPSQIALNDRFQQLNLESSLIGQKEQVSIRPFPKFQEQEFKVFKTSARWYLSYPRTQEIRDEWMKLSGQSEELELRERQAAAKLIQKIGGILDVSQTTIDTSIVFMHRFYIFHPIEIFPHDTISAACLYLGGKVSDYYRKLHQVVEAQAMAKNGKKKLMQSETEDMGAEVKTMEEFVVATIAGDFEVEHPITLDNIYKACTFFELNKRYKETALHIAQKTLQLTTFCIQYPPKLIAAFCIYKTLKLHGKVIFDNFGKPWFSYVDKNIQLSMLEDMAYEFDFIERQVRECNGESMGLSRQSSSSQKRGLEGDNPKMVKRMSYEAESQESSSAGRRDKFESERTDPVSIRSHLEACISGASAGHGYSLLGSFQASRGAKILHRALSLPGNSTAKSTGMRKETSGMSAETFSQGNSSKFIKSSVPMKFNPVKPVVEKLSSSEEFARLNKLVEAEAAGAYSAVNPLKKRVAHTREPSSSLQGMVGGLQQSTPPTRSTVIKQETAVNPRLKSEVYPNIANVAMEKVASGFESVAVHSSNDTPPASLEAELDDNDKTMKQEVLKRPRKKEKKDSKDKKKKKKLKHDKKARQYDESSAENSSTKHPSVKVNPPSTDTNLIQGESVIQLPIPKVVIKKVADGSENYSSALC